MEDLTQQSRHLDRVIFVLDLGLFLLAHGHEVLGHVPHVHHAGCVLEHLDIMFLESSSTLNANILMHSI